MASPIGHYDADNDPRNDIQTVANPNSIHNMGDWPIELVPAVRLGFQV